MAVAGGVWKLWSLRSRHNCARGGKMGQENPCDSVDTPPPNHGFAWQTRPLDPRWRSLETPEFFLLHFCKGVAPASSAGGRRVLLQFGLRGDAGDTGHGGIVPVQGFAGLAPATCQSRPAWRRWLRLGTAWRRPRARAWRPVRFRARQWLLAYVELRALSSRRVSEPLNLSLQLRQFVGLRPYFGCLRFEIGFGQQGDCEMAAALEIKNPSNVGCALNRLFYKGIAQYRSPKEAEMVT